MNNVMMCDIEWMSNYKELCPESDECVWWTVDGCKMMLRDEK